MIQRLSSKQPQEEKYIAFDFSPALEAAHNPDAGEDLASIEAVKVVNVDTDEDVSADMTVPENNRAAAKLAYIWVTGGDNDNVYQVTCRVKTATSYQILELDALLPVREY